MKLYITAGPPCARVARIVIIEKGLEDRIEIVPAQTRLTPTQLRGTAARRFRALCASSLSQAQACFAELYPQTAFAPGWHIELIAAIPGTARKSLPRPPGPAFGRPEDRLRPGAGRPGRRRCAAARSAG